MTNKYYAGKRVLSIGAGKRVLSRLTKELNRTGFAAVFTYAYNQPERIFSNFNPAHFDVIAMGRGVIDSHKEIIKSRFRKENPALAFVEGLAPITKLLADQVKLACLPGTIPAAQVHFLPDSLQINVPSACQLQVRFYYMNWLYMSYEKMWLDAYTKAGIVNIPLQKSKGFLSISQDGIITGVFVLDGSKH